MNSNRPRYPFSQHSRRFLFAVSSGLIVCSALFISGCATVGKDFPVTQVDQIKMGQTTQREIRAMFGSPWRTGIEDGQRTWTYGNYNYRLFSTNKAKDLLIRFDGRNVVDSYTFSTTDHQQ